MSTSRPSLWRVLSETWSIIRARSCHFLAMSFLFLLPASVATCTFTLLFQPTSLPSHLRRFLSSPESELPSAGESQLLLFQLLYHLFQLKLHTSVISSITYTVFNAFFMFLITIIFSTSSMFLSESYTGFMASYGGEWGLGWLVVHIVVYAAFSSILSLYSFVAETVVFVYCKPLHGELVFTQINDKLDHDANWFHCLCMLFSVIFLESFVFGSF